MTTVLVVEYEPAARTTMANFLRKQGYDSVAAPDYDTALELLREREVDVIVAGIVATARGAFELLEESHAHCPSIPILAVAGEPGLGRIPEFLKAGACNYMLKPVVEGVLIDAVSRALERKGAIDEGTRLNSEADIEPGESLFRADERTRQSIRATYRHDEIGSEPHPPRWPAKRPDCTYGMVGTSAGMLAVYETIRTTADSDASVLIEGESGTGKELVAAAFHNSGGRASKPFIHINCAAIPNELLESELFGYRKGAFTGADRDKRGLMEAASGGSLLLDEVTEIPLHLQAKLLRVLQERRLRRLGDEREIQVDFRLISATNRDTGRAMKDGMLREDLYFRIGTIKLSVPPLRRRLDDLMPLADHFLRLYSSKYKRNIAAISQEVVGILVKYDWPGNVRELESVIERAVLFCGKSEIATAHLPDHIRDRHLDHSACEIPPFWTLEEIEREAIAQTLARTGGNVKKAAQLLRVPRPTFYRKLRKLGLSCSVIRHDC